MPVVFEITDILGKILHKITHLRKKAQEMSKKQETITVKVEEKETTSETKKTQ